MCPDQLRLVPSLREKNSHQLVETACRRGHRRLDGSYHVAFFTGVEFGIQPLLFKSADGSPLYAPYPLSVSIPAMVVPHALVASVAEAFLTVLVLAYLLRSNPAILETAEKSAQGVESAGIGTLRRLWIVLLALAVVSPLGLLAPGTAWGEWGTEELAQMGLKAIPEGIARLSGLWGAPLQDYNLPALGNSNLGYILSLSWASWSWASSHGCLPRS